jgi:hypothetical protein
VGSQELADHYAVATPLKEGAVTRFKILLKSRAGLVREAK